MNPGWARTSGGNDDTGSGVAEHPLPPLTGEAAPVDDSVLVVRGLGIAGLVGVALVHLVQLPETVSPTPGLGALFIALVLAAALVAAGLVRADLRVLWYATALTAAGPLLGYVLTRSVRVPFDGEDVGAWTEPVGLVALFLEGCLLALSVYRLVALGPAGQDRAPSGEVLHR